MFGTISLMMRRRIVRRRMLRRRMMMKWWRFLALFLLLRLSQITRTSKWFLNAFGMH
jgi:hypothetical protein